MKFKNVKTGEDVEPDTLSADLQLMKMKVACGSEFSQFDPF